MNKIFLDSNKLVISRNPFNKDDLDFKTIVDKVKEENIDLIFVASHMPQSAEIIKELKIRNIKAKIVTLDVKAVDSDFQKLLGKLTEGVVFSGTDFERNTNPEFWDKYVAKYKRDPSMYSAQAYDAIKILGAIIKSKCFDGNSYCIKDELYKINNYTGASGPLTINKYGDAQKEIVIKEIRNEKFVKIEN